MPLSKKNPTSQKSWSSLVELYIQENNIHINDYFKSENDRLENFTISFNDLYVDFSKNRISKKAFDLLIELCEETDLKENINKYFNGSFINETENRSVLHTALRSKNNDSTEISEQVKNTLSKIKTISDEINNGVRVGHSGKKIENVVNIGIGGSHLGPEMVTEALSFYSQGIKPYFISNIDPDYTENILKSLNPDTTIFIIVSKTFTTIETLENAKKVRKWFVKNVNEESIKNHFIAVSNNTEDTKEFGIESKNILSIPEWVGGRIYLWSYVGLII